jgi:peroxiredoxin
MDRKAWKADELMINNEDVTETPDFTAKDSQDNLIRISEYRHKKNVVLVFNRGFV